MNKILFIDSVTTGMSPERCAIYRSGGIFAVDGVEVKRFEIRMRHFPGADIAGRSLDICEESRATLARYPSQEKGFRDFIALLDEQVDRSNPRDKMYISGFNSSRFEYAFIMEWFHRCDNRHFRDYFYVQTYDLMTLTCLYAMEKRPFLPDFKLETAARILGVSCPVEDRYDCISNARTCMDMFRVLALRWGVAELPSSPVTDNVFKNF